MDYNPQLVKFETTDHLFLPGLLYEPKVKSDEVAIFLHGNGSSSIFYAVDRMNTIAQKLNEKGVAFFPFNNRGAHFIKSLTQKISEEDDDKVIMGMTYELVKDCVQDIDGAINFLKARGYKKFYLIGHSTGATKVVLYHYLKRDNNVAKYILLSGGDDTGIYYNELGEEKFHQALQRSKEMIAKRKGRDLVPKTFAPFPISYQSLYDTINPDGDYNVFPFNEYINDLKLSTKPLFKEYKSLNKPTLVVYGENDELCNGQTEKYVSILKKENSHPAQFTFQIIPGADHSFSAHHEELAGIISSWITKT